jgi:CPA2 family monovalent cation:H+ antiporter-2
LPARAALTAAIALGQMGEFSFIFASVALDEGLFDASENEALLAGIVLSMAVNPLLFAWRRPLVEAGRRLPAPPWADVPTQAPGDTEPERLRRHVVVCGYDEEAAHVIETVRTRFAVVVIDDDLVTIRRLRQEGLQAILGDPSIPVILERARVDAAQVLVVTVHDARQAQAIVREARRLNERLDIIARAGGQELTRALLDAGATQVVEPELEAGLEFVRHTLHRMGVSSMEIQAILRGRRRRVTGGG